MKQVFTDVHVVENNASLTSSMRSLAAAYNLPVPDTIHWRKNGSRYHLVYQGKVLYSEPIQHVQAVAKLMRIPEKIWLLWAFNSVHLAKYRRPVSLPLSQRLEIFRQAYIQTIKKYYKRAEPFPVKPTVCLNCQSHGPFTLDYKYTPVRPIAVVFCQQCGLGVRYPRDSRQALSKIYEDNYFSGSTTDVGYADYFTEEAWRIKKAEDYLGRLESLLRLNPIKTSVLDVGSGFGYFLVPIKKRGYQYLGIELASEAADIANKKFRTKTLIGDLQSLHPKSLKDGSFDLITLWDVIEHFYDFRDDLSITSKLLTPGGFVALRTNNIASIEYRVFGNDFHSIKNEHTFYYSEWTLTDIFKLVGITPYKIWSHTHLFLAFMTKKEINNINRTNRGGDIFYVGQKKK